MGLTSRGVAKGVEGERAGSPERKKKGAQNAKLCTLKDNSDNLTMLKVGPLKVQFGEKGFFISPSWNIISSKNKYLFSLYLVKGGGPWVFLFLLRQCSHSCFPVAYYKTTRSPVGKDICNI